MFVQNFDRDFDAIVEAQEPFALIRFHDGEHAILDGLPYSAASKWTITGQEVWLRKELHQSLHASMDRFYIGISPPCCTPQATDYYRRNLVISSRSKVTYSTIFMHRNYRRVPRLRARFPDACIVSSGVGDIQIPPNGVTQPWDIDAVVSQLLAVDRPILVAGGPCANLIIYRYWQRQDASKRQTILDIGAALDSIVHGKKTRHHQEAKSSMMYHACEWDKWAAWAPTTQDQRDLAIRMAKQQQAFKTGKVSRRVATSHRGPRVIASAAQVVPTRAVPRTASRVVVSRHIVIRGKK
jgi:hypothetical protein